MIESFHISHFKGFEDFELSRLAPITLLAGRNNVGKSTILEALFTFFDRLDPRILMNSYGWRGVSSTAVSADAMWAPCFTDYNLSKPIKLGAKINGRNEAIEIRFESRPLAQTIPSSLKQNGELPSIKTDQPGVPSVNLAVVYSVEGEQRQVFNINLSNTGLSFGAEGVQPTGEKIAIINLRTHEDTNQLSALYGALDVVGEQYAIAEFLKIIEPRLKSLSVVSIGGTAIIHADVGTGRKIPVAYMGDGMARLLSIIIFAATNKNGALLIDEIESGLHYSIMPKIWEAISLAGRQYNCQIIGTTHSYECLNAAKEGLPEDRRKDFLFVRLDKKDDVVRAKYFDFDLFNASLESDMEIR